MLCRKMMPYHSLTHPANSTLIGLWFFICVCPRAVTCESEWALRFRFTVFSTVSWQPHVASECLKQAQCDGGTELLIAFNLDYLKQRKNEGIPAALWECIEILGYPPWTESLHPLRGPSKIAWHGCPRGHLATPFPTQHPVISKPSVKRKQILSTSVHSFWQCPAHSSLNQVLL